MLCKSDFAFASAVACAAGLVFFASIIIIIYEKLFVVQIELVSVLCFRGDFFPEENASKVSIRSVQEKQWTY